MSKKFNILIMGASYGSLLASKFLLAGHSVKLVCLPTEVELINAEGILVKMPIRGRAELVEIDSRKAPGILSACSPGEANPAEYDLVVLAVQEPQYRNPAVRDLLDRVANAKIPCMSIMNMPPLPYLARIPGVDVASVRSSYADPTVWDKSDPALMTLCSPDPQAFRPPQDKLNVLQVRLPTNFKAARFESDAHTAMLKQLEEDIMAIRFDAGDGTLIELPVKLKVSESVFVPLAKWSMLVAGNYRCIQEHAIRSAKEAVHTNIDESREIYNWVIDLCKSLGATDKELVPFEKYADAAQLLETPSSAARALFAGAPNIERVDLLVKTLATQKNMKSKFVDEIVGLVDARLDANRRALA